jgi:hypothetical protein
MSMEQLEGVVIGHWLHLIPGAVARGVGLL